MSVHVTSWVWKHSRSKGNGRLVLLSIADQANDDGYAWPSVGNIAERCRISERAVQTHIRDLQAIGELEVELRSRSNGSQSSNGYTVLYR